MSAPMPAEEIRRFLAVRRVLLVIVIGGFYGAVALGLGLWLASGQPVVQTTAYFAAMVIAGAAATLGGYLLRIAHCPRCGKLFSVRAGGKGRNNFTTQCMNCGLRLDGSNIN